ncbi:MAG: 50S ribosomal protein L15 [Muribaculaceae bacterium]|nr:50S ribosomal protein L15 [Muribaculaceae bacterium]
MDLSNLKPAAGSVTSKTRIGRGPGSGKGGTSTRGHKGAKSRSGYSRKIGFEGGQMPLQRRLPKFGFKPLDKTIFKPINLSDLEALATEAGVEKITIDTMIEAGLANGKQPVKILAGGTLTKKIEVEANAFSAAAEAAITAAGGSATKI